VSGYIQSFFCFVELPAASREFLPHHDPTAGRADYLPEPDSFHDVAGTSRCIRQHFATLVRLAIAHTAAEIVQEFATMRPGSHAHPDHQEAMARFFWFPSEFGLMRHRVRPCVFIGIGLLSSFGRSHIAWFRRRCGGARNRLGAGG